ncbi:Multidrug resistance-associated protein 1 [Hypsibius exemplaris]|uniref:ABC-type glutathione-S-conjugate transporter n=1 Tax=Hypsibius exemplaris TaxID=2072580 RepID=A0A1W0WAW4_HYPEX|nr:Multidrug resistance-associated protein 1 [Hypsibius exemplaris]
MSNTTVVPSFPEPASPFYLFPEGFCSDAFWDMNLTWHTESPDLTRCFKSTVLAWIPAVFLVLMVPLQYYSASNAQQRNKSWTWNSFTKILCGVCLAVIALTELTSLLYKWASFVEKVVPDAELIAAAVRLVAYVLAVGFIFTDKCHARTSSGPLFFFWLISSCAEAILFGSSVRNGVRDGIDDKFMFILRVIYLPLTVAELILASFGDHYADSSFTEPETNPCPEKWASFPSALTYWWFNPMGYLGWKRPLTQKDMWDIQPRDTTGVVVEPLEKHWKEEMEKMRRSKEERTVPNYSPSLMKALVKTYWPTLAATACLRLCSDLSAFATPQILRLLISFVESKDEETWKGYFWAVLMFLATVIQSLAGNYGWQLNVRAGMNAKAGIIAAVYRKSLKITSAVKQGSSVGEMVNLVSVDSQRFMDFMGFVHLLWSAPIQIALALYFLYTFLGVAAIAGVVTIAFTVPINAYAFTNVKTQQNIQMREKDYRIKLMTEILNGIKVLKLYAWEEAFEREILKIRKRELIVLKKSAYFGALSYVFFCLSPILVALASFAAYVLVDPSHILTPQIVFGVLSLINIMRVPMTMMSPAVMITVQVLISEKRLSKFLQSDELDLGNVKTLPASSPVAVAVTGGTFAWNETDAVCLKNIEVAVKDGELAAVVGQVGAGKSSLCAAMIGLMERRSGEVGIKGKVAYVPQQAWIQNLTVRDNILFGKPMDQALYQKVIRACALQPDFDSFPAADLTEIGERGANLSGGQRQRISLARATYSNSDVYIFDDPLSAVDAHVGKHIFENVIGPSGMLHGKTRILVTHGIGFLPQADQIIVLSGGTVSECGTYKELLHQKGAFAEFLLTYLEDEKHEHDEEGGPSSEELTPRSVKEEILEEIGEDTALLAAVRRASNGSLLRVKSVLRQASKLSLRSKGRGAESSGKSESIELVENSGKLVDEEKAQTGMVKWSVYFMFMKQMSYLITVLIAVLFVTFSALGTGANFWLSDWAEDHSDARLNGDVAQRNFRLGIYGLFAVLQLIFIVGFSISLAEGRIRASQNIHQKLLYRILRCPMSFFDTTPLGRIVNRFSRDVDTVDTLIPGNIEFWLFCSFSVASTLVVIAIALPYFTAVIVPVAVFYYFMQRFYISTSRQLKRIESLSRSPVYSHFQESVAGNGVIIAMKESNRFIQTNERLVDVNNSSLYLNLAASRWISVRLEFLGIFITFCAAIFGIIGRDRDWVEPKDMGLAITYALSVSGLLNWLIWVTSELEGNIVAVERIKEYTEVPQEADWVNHMFRPPSEWPTEGKVDFEDYQTRYRPGLDLVLKGLDANIYSGEKIGIVGRTGAGKSSLTLALFRIIEPSGGHIHIDGLDVSRMGLHDLRSRITILPQEPVLFSGTLRLNLDPFGKYTDKEVWTALENSHLKLFVSALPEGLDHIVVDGGENYSVGQRQLICLARALLRKTKILVLDEATAAIDLQTDDLIQQTIRREFADCTILTIAHRINTIMDSTRIMVLDYGRVKEFATPADLLADKQGVFYGLAKAANLVA